MVHPVRRMTLVMTLAVALAVALVPPARAARNPVELDFDDHAFAHVGTFDVRRNGTLVAEIVAATSGGRTLVYTDSETGQIGFVDITNRAKPRPAGTLDMGGEPTSVAIDDSYALVAVNTSPSFTEPSGSLIVVDVRKRTVVETFELPGQPDSVAISPDGEYAAVVIENERDEEVDEGLIPQLPSGSLVVVEKDGEPSSWEHKTVDLTGLADIAPSDAEPEYVDINEDNRAVVSLQENNHFAIVDLRRARVVADFPAGEVTLEDVDATEEELGPQGNGDIQLADIITRRREPDAVAWIDGDTFASANEGDYVDADGVQGGSRDWTLFDVDGNVEAEAGTSFEYAAIRAGHYPEGRSADKGAEPESAAVGRFAGHDLLFVGAERANLLQVIDVTDEGDPELLQVLPTGIGPEGIAMLEDRGLIAVSSETAVEGVPSLITLYALVPGDGDYPQLASADSGGVPIPWVAQSGLAGDLQDADTLWSVSDSILGVGYVYEIDLDADVPTIVAREAVTGASFNLDLEGIADAPEGGFWLASEGRLDARPNALLKTDEDYAVTDEIVLPEDLAAQMTDSGFEGLAIEPTEDGTGTMYVYAVVQREWADDAAREVKIARYDVAAGTWAFASYPLEPVASPAGGWVGLSEITRLPDGTFAILERDNQLGVDARIKRLYRVDLAAVDFAPYGAELPLVEKELYTSLLDELARESVWTPDKLEGVGVAADGELYAVTDNDGLDDAIGQTVFLHLGEVTPAAE